MAIKAALFLSALLIGAFGVPTKPEYDASYFHSPAGGGNRVIGGGAAPQGSVPYMVALTNGLLIRSFVCGGSLIRFNTVMTAAHCVEAVYTSARSLSTTLRGTVGTNNWNIGGTSYIFARNVTHQHYVSNIIKNDIALLITTTNVEMGPFVAVVPISFLYVDGGVETRAAGWGRTVVGGVIPSQLQELRMSTISGWRCVLDAAAATISLNMPSPHIEPALELCTFHSPGHGMCHGDSGSALVRADNGQQVGIVSWGFPCAIGAPDMFVRVSAYLTWIIQNLLTSD